MDQALQSGGIVGILVLLIIQQVFAFVQRRNDKGGNSRRYSQDCALSKVCEMRHESLRDLIVHVNDNLTAQTALLRDVAKDVAVVKGKVR